MNLRVRLSVVVLAAAAAAALAQPPAKDPVPVTVRNFIRAETDMYFGNFVKQAGGLGKLRHAREPVAVDKQTVVRMNRDTLYSSVVVDLDAGPVTITLPKSGKRFMSLMLVNEDHYVFDVGYGAGTYVYPRAKAGTRYAAALVRTLVDPTDPKDLQQVHALQDAIKVTQAKPGTFEVPNWDSESRTKVRDALVALAKTGSGYTRAFGSRKEVDPIEHLIGTATGWGGNPAKDATYVGVQPARNDGSTVYRLDIKDVPVDGFWSVSEYNAQGFFEKNAQDAYAVNNLTAKKEADGSVVVQFGGCDGKVPNCLPIVNGWNYTVRLYRPRAEILNGKWKFPQARPV